MEYVVTYPGLDSQSRRALHKSYNSTLSGDGAWGDDNLDLLTGGRKRPISNINPQLAFYQLSVPES